MKKGAIAAAVIAVVALAFVAGRRALNRPPAQDEQIHVAPELLTLAEDFRQFRSPIFRPRTWAPTHAVEGVPDYAAAVRAQRDGLPAFQARLRALDPAGWPVHDQVDYLLLRAEMDDVEFEHRVLRETATNPSFYIEQAIDAVANEMGAVVPYTTEKAEAIIAAFERT